MSHDRVVVFISYSHDSDEHRTRVLGLSESLRKDGFETRLDRYLKGAPAGGWPRWMMDQVDEATHVLVVCTPPYYERFRGRGSTAHGRGADWEGAIITQHLYDTKGRSSKFIPITFAADYENVPDPLRSGTTFRMDEAGYSSLRDLLAGVAGVEPGPIGQRPHEIRPTAKPLFPPRSPTRHEEPVRVPARLRGWLAVAVSATVLAAVAIALLLHHEPAQRAKDCTASSPNCTPAAPLPESPAGTVQIAKPPEPTPPITAPKVRVPIVALRCAPRPKLEEDPAGSPWKAVCQEPNGPLRSLTQTKSPRELNLGVLCGQLGCVTCKEVLSRVRSFCPNQPGDCQKARAYGCGT